MKIRIPCKWLTLIGTVLYFNIIFQPSFGTRRFNFKEGEIATEDIIAPSSFSIPKTEEELQEERNAIAQRLPPVYDYKPEVLTDLETTLTGLERMIDTLRRYDRDTIIYLIQRDYGMPKDLIFYLLKNNHKYILMKLLKELGFYLSRGIVANKSLPHRILTVVRGGKETLISIDEVYSVAEVESTLSSRAPNEYKQLVRFFIKPNIILNSRETEKRIEEVYANVKKTKGEVLKGELIVEKHKKIDRTALEKLEALEKTYKITGTSETLKTLIFRNLFFVAIFLLFLFYNRQANLNLLNEKNFYFIVLLLVIYVALGKIFYETHIIYGLPIAFFIYLIALYFNFNTGLFTGIVLSSIFGVIYKSLPAFVFLLVSSITACLLRPSLKSRYLLYRPALYLSLVNVLTIFFIDNYIAYTGIDLINIGMGILNGFVSIVALVIFLPLFESIFDFTTDFTLVELGNLNLPIFKEMSISAPGTYHHSVIVGNLAEAGARAIGADPILARVGAYYHDIGKLKKPEYFIENQIGQKNPHDNLKPQMSALVIISHVKDGYEMGKNMKLPKNILAIISEHHGTSRIESFYKKALSTAEKVSEDVFTYPGPKPKTKEAALVMLADSVEAAARAEKNITVSKLQKILRESFDKKFNEGQLDECPISRVDLENIKTAFLPILLGIFHPRIEYESHEAKDKYL
ncbi:MAG: HDIG domain-containing protein [candidate division WOR-3 bacterium]|nr:HDIG domain-containing protein [candidate division WOR-3 bacterium]